MNSIILGTEYIGGTSGNGYGAGLYRTRDERGYVQSYIVLLSLHGLVKRQHCATYNEASDLRETFCHACHMWNVTQARERAMAQGFAVLGR